MTIISEDQKSIEEKIINPAIIRIHHSTLVNPDFIKEFSSETNEVTLINGKM